jgi:protocatechuate 3,4-dioxygenase beta subunit
MNTTLTENRGEGLRLIDDAASVTPIVKAAMALNDDPRLKQIVDAFVDHAHAFLREVKLTDQEFERGLQFIAAVGQANTDSHNEVVLAADVLGISTLVTVLNTTGQGDRTPGALLGPFYRGNAPECEVGADIARDGTPGVPLFMRGVVRDTTGKPLANALLDVWQASPVGLYDNQDPNQPDKNLRGQFRTDEHGRYEIRSVRPAGYPVPVHGPIGKLLAMQHRHPYRPAHVHFIVSAADHDTLVAQVFADDSEYLETDVVFGVQRGLVGHFEWHEDGAFPWGDGAGPHYTLDFDFTLAAGTPTYPTPPIA